MEILKNLSEAELDALRGVFDGHPERGLNETNFRRTLLRASRGKVLAIRLSRRYFNHLFASIDVHGDGRVTWDQLTMFCIDHARSLVGEASVDEKNLGLSSPTSLTLETTLRCSSSPIPSQRPFSVDSECSNSSSDYEGGFVDPKLKSEAQHLFSFHPYHAAHVVPQPYGTRTTDMRVIERIKKVVKVTADVKGTCAVNVYNIEDRKLSMYASLSRSAGAVVSWDYIPAVAGVSNSNTLACAYNGGLVQLFPMQKYRTFDDVLHPSHSIKISETQTAILWAGAYHRLAMGSRCGVVSVWDVDEQRVANLEKIHNARITGLCIRNGMMYTGSLDRSDSVKVVDLERSVVRYAFNDHHLGGVMAIEMDDDFLFSVGFETKISQRLLQCPRSHPIYLDDVVQPHQGRITTVRRLHDSSILLTGDTKGLVKMWDVRMGSCVQTMSMDSTSSTATVGVSPSTAALTSRGVRSHQTKLAVCQHLSRSIDRLDDDNAPSVDMICPLPGLGDIIMVGTKKDLVVLTVAETTCPGNADDVQACRFLLQPNAQQILTVHDRGVKLWNTLTGHLVYATERDLVPSDITACALVDPLRRQFILATMESHVECFSVALGQSTLDLTPTLRKAGMTGKEVLSLHLLQRYSKYSSPCMVLAYSTGVTLLPMVEECPVSSVIHLQVLHAILGDRFRIRDAMLRDGLLFVSVTTNVVYAVDLVNTGRVVASYRLPGLAVENMFMGHVPIDRCGAIHPTLSTSRGFHCVDSAETHRNGANSLFFCGDSSGHVIVGESRPVPFDPVTSRAPHRNGGVSCGEAAAAATRRIHTLLGDWDAGDRNDTWKWASTAAKGRSARTAYRVRRSMSTVLNDTTVASQGATMKPTDVLASPEDLPHCPKHRSPVVTNMCFISSFCVLVTVDARGTVKLWDMLGIVLGSAAERQVTEVANAAHLISRDPDSFYPPRLMAEWVAHEVSVTDVVAIKCPASLLPVIVTASVDREVRLWSADGLSLGTLAAGRQTDDASGGSRYGLPPYNFAKTVERGDLEAHWKRFRAYMKRRALARERHMDPILVTLRRLGSEIPRQSFLTTQRPTDPTGEDPSSEKGVSSPQDSSYNLRCLSSIYGNSIANTFVTESHVEILTESTLGNAFPEESPSPPLTNIISPPRIPAPSRDRNQGGGDITPQRQPSEPPAASPPLSNRDAVTLTNDRSSEKLPSPRESTWNCILKPVFAQALQPRASVPVTLARTGGTVRRLPNVLSPPRDSDLTRSQGRRSVTPSPLLPAIALGEGATSLPRTTLARRKRWRGGKSRRGEAQRPSRAARDLHAATGGVVPRLSALLPSV